MDHTTWWGTQSNWLWIVPFLFMILLFVCAARMIRCAGAWRRGAGHRTGWTPLAWCRGREGSMARWRAETPQLAERRRDNADTS